MTGTATRDEDGGDEDVVAAGRCVNVRDVGGAPAAGGLVVRRGLLFRGDAPRSGDVPPELPGWPPTTVVDLRSADEGERYNLMV